MIEQKKKYIFFLSSIEVKRRAGRHHVDAQTDIGYLKI